MGDRVHRIQKAAEIPEDVTNRSPVLNMTGFNHMTIENYRGIIEYTDKIIRILTIHGQIRVNGTHLYIEYFTNDEMKITGAIKMIEYEPFLDGERS